MKTFLIRAFQFYVFRFSISNQNWKRRYFFEIYVFCQIKKPNKKILIFIFLKFVLNQNRFDFFFFFSFQINRKIQKLQFAFSEFRLKSKYTVLRKNNQSKELTRTI